MKPLDETAFDLFKISNIRRFIAFRVFFNCRFYYPVFTVLFLDFGLSLEQFAILNAVWAATIVLFEVPSGALADVIGRRNLLVASGTLMVMEIGLLCVVPPGKGTLLFTVFIVNRILSGLAEAFASGADEALAYDTLKTQGDPAQWGRVLERQMRYRSIAFVAASVLGAALYDPKMVSIFLHAFGIQTPVTQADTLKLPLYFTFLMAVCTCLTTLGMKEPVPNGVPNSSRAAAHPPRLIHALGVTFRAGGFILRTPMALAVILAGMMVDHIARMMITLASEYFRLIAIPEAAFGIIGAALAMSGLVIPRIALWMSRRFGKGMNLFVVSACCFFGILGMTQFWPIAGLLPALLLFSAMMMAGFFVSHYLNDITDSSQRATVLSFKGLCFNLAYGAIGVAYAGLINRIRENAPVIGTDLGESAMEDALFKKALAYFPNYFLFIFTLLMVFLSIHFRISRKRPP